MFLTTSQNILFLLIKATVSGISTRLKPAQCLFQDQGQRSFLFLWGCFLHRMHRFKGKLESLPENERNKEESRIETKERSSPKSSDPAMAEAR